MELKTFLCGSFLCGVFAGSASGAISLQLSATPPQPRPVGTVIAWSASATDTNPGSLDFRFEVKSPGGSFAVVRDFYPSGELEWAPSFREGTFEIRVTARNRLTTETAEAIQSYQVTHRLLGLRPSVSATANPLVALFSGPGCPAGQQVRVRYRSVASLMWLYTDWRPCTTEHTYNVYVAGLVPSLAHALQQEVSGTPSTYGPVQWFTAGPLPDSPEFPLFTIPLSASVLASIEDQFTLYGPLPLSADHPSFPMATDLSGTVRWFYPKLAQSSQTGFYLTRLVAGGSLLLLVNDELRGSSTLAKNQILREIDLAGNTLRETNVTAVNAQLRAMGKPPVTSFHHEAVRLPNGHTLLIASLERILVDKQGPGPVDVVGDAVVDLDGNLRVAWFWDSFDHLDQTRKPVLGEGCLTAAPGCPPLVNALFAVDWTHTNSIHYVLSDGSLLLSLRHFDWVIKIHYAHGTGDGHVIWRLGEGGDFTPVSAYPQPWFSHQHDAEFESNGLLSLYDNGNTRREQADPEAHSRGQAWALDEAARTAYLLVNADLLGYSMAFGAAELLKNGNYHFCSGIVTLNTYGVETMPIGLPVYAQRMNQLGYRSFRLSGFYGQ